MSAPAATAARPDDWQETSAPLSSAAAPPPLPAAEAQPARESTFGWLTRVANNLVHPAPAPRSADALPAPFTGLSTNEQHELLRGMTASERATALAALPPTHRTLLLGSSSLTPSLHDFGPAYDVDWNAQLHSGGYDADTAWVMAVAAKRVYEPLEEQGPEVTRWVLPLLRAGYEVKFLGHEGIATQGFVALKGEQAIVAMRGTQPGKLDDLILDCKFLRIEGSGGLVHRGFQLALDLVWGQLRRILENAQLRQAPGKKLQVHLTGHSLGAALATLAAERIATKDIAEVGSVYTFGSPRVFDGVAAARYEGLLGDRTFRFENNADVVAVVPPEVMGFKHVGTTLFFDHLGNQHLSPPQSLVKEEAVRGPFESSSKSRLARGFEPEILWDHGVQGYVKHVYINATSEGPAPKPKV